MRIRFLSIDSLVLKYKKIIKGNFIIFQKVVFGRIRMPLKKRVVELK